MAKKWVYLSRNGEEEYTQVLGSKPDLAQMKNIMGGKGAGLMAMSGR